MSSSKPVYDTNSTKDLDDMVQIVKAFLNYSEELFKREIIPEDLYQQLIKSKIKFLKDFDRLK